MQWLAPSPRVLEALTLGPGSRFHFLFVSARRHTLSNMASGARFTSLLTCLVLVVPCVPATSGSHTSWPLCGFHTSKSHVHYIRPAHTGRPTRTWVDSIRPTHVWILYIPAMRGSHTSWPLYGFHMSKPHVDSIRPGQLDSIRPNQVWILYVPLIWDVPHVPLILWIPYVPPKCGFHMFSVRLWHLSPSVGP